MRRSIKFCVDHWINRLEWNRAQSRFGLSFWRAKGESKCYRRTEGISGMYSEKPEFLLTKTS